MAAVGGQRDDGRILVVGMGRSGAAAARAALKELPGVGVVVCDEKEEPLAAADVSALREAGALVELGRGDPGLLEGCGLVVKSPGVPRQNPLIEEALSRGIPVWGEVEFARRFLGNVIVGITGTNGKTTTAELMAHILTEAGKPCRVAGNVGTALSSLVGSVEDEEVLVVELSSFQLEDSIDFRPDVAVLLNLAEDHLDRHGTLDEYFDAKMRIFANQGGDDAAVLNFDDANIRSREAPGAATRVWFSGADAGEAGARPGEPGKALPSVFVRGGAICADIGAVLKAGGEVRSRLAGGAGAQETGGAAPRETGGEKTGQGRNGFSGGEDSQEILAWSKAALKGDHNLENALAATAACLCLGVEPEDVAAGLRSFPGVRHRLQEVGVVGGVTYVNDSKATNVDSTLKALTAYEGGIHMILGGSSKGSSFDRLAEAAAPGKVREVILIGEAADDIAASFEKVSRDVVMAGRLEEAVRIAGESAVAGDIVLLAPACASFDQYRDFEERGDHFISLVEWLAAGAEPESGED